MAEIQDRSLNLIFRGIKELQSEDVEERKRSDTQGVVVVAQCAGIDRDVFQKAMVAVRRLGKREEGKQYRPLLVRLTSQELREQLLRRNKSLRKVNEKEGSRYRIDPDLTQEQKAKLDDLWETARKKTAEAKNGVKYFVIGKENPRLRSEKVEQEREESSLDHGTSAEGGS